MRIAFLTDTYAPEVNGVVTSVANFTRFLSEAGHEILVIAPQYDGREYAEAPGISIRRYPAFSFSSNKETRIAVPFLTAILRDLRGFRPDIVHIQTPMSIGVTGILASRILGIRSIQTYHSYIPDFLTYLSPYKLLGINRVVEKMLRTGVAARIEDAVQGGRLEGVFAALRREHDAKDTKRGSLKRHSGETFAAFRDRAAWNLTRFLYNRSDYVLTPSAALARLLVEHEVRVPVFDVSNGIEFGYFEKKADYALRHRMVFAGRLGYEKNVDVVIRALAAARRREPRLHLSVYGDGPARRKLESLAAHQGLEGHVTFHGFVDRQTLKNVYRDYDYTVSASAMETQGLALLEAMAAGLPVLGVNALAVPDIVKDGANGYVVDPGDSGGMAEAMLRLAEDPLRNARFGARSLEIAATHDLPLCVKRLEGIYARLLKTGTPQTVSPSEAGD